ncbi:glycosyltransferase [Methanobrevibacter curvatus]|uniref:CDP-glycerol:poly(Glycerophosphate) glycerophosphotransferase n=1 Tax=Methanobrevibacter curvatus TaxID=49547 RepID=A0A165ZR79_9EURY|nr:glycosyltransferase [Methanobrevibacter curvatus]KZX11061.1 CDP-glycerol:poly(glycerophosphate) glycerophosphotransferase [Methanobrevibacter curvatus]
MKNKIKARVKFYRKKFRRVFGKGKALVKNSFLVRYESLEVDDNLILLESKNGKDLGSNIFYLLKELSNERYEKYTVILAIKKDKKECIEKFLRRYNIENVVLCFIPSLKYFKYLNTAKYLFNDTTFPYQYIKKDSQIYVNTWHGTPLKNLGKYVKKRAYSIGNVQRNLAMADYIILPNGFSKDVMIDSYMIEKLSKGKSLLMNYPRNEVFLNQQRKNEIKSKLNLNNNEIIVYMPTYRGILGGSNTEEYIEKLENYFREIDEHLSSKQTFYVKLHPFIKKSIDYSNYKNITSFPENYETYDFLNLADCLITDYSSVFFDFAITKNKIILFPYDEEEYVKNHGLKINLQDLPFPKVYDVENLILEINSRKNYDDEEFLRKFCPYPGENASKHLCDFILLNIPSKNVIVQNINTLKDKNEKENVLIYAGNFARNGISTSLLALLENIDLNKRNYFLGINTKTTKRYSSSLAKIAEKIHYIPIRDNEDFTILEGISYKLYINHSIKNNFIEKNLDNAYKRNLRKNFNSIDFDTVIHFTGYELKITNLLRRFRSKKIIFVHNDLVQEIETKQNHHFLTLKDFYNDCDKIAIVNEDLRLPISKIKGSDKNIMVVENFIDYEGIINRSNEEVSFDEITKTDISPENLKKILDNEKFKKFITIGRFSHEKGHIRLLKIFNEFYKKNKDVYLIIIGGYGREYIKTLEHAQSLESSDNIIIINYLTNPFPILKKCDLFILPSFYEGLGLVILEADILGVKVFSTDVSGPKTFMGKYGGFLVENSKEGIRNGIEAFLNGEIDKLNIDYKQYNKEILKHFENLFR